MGYYGGARPGASVAVVRVSSKSLLALRVRGAFDSPRCEPSRVRMIIRYWCLSSSALSWRVKSSFASVSSQSSSHCLTSSASSSSAPHSVGRRRSRVRVGQKKGRYRRGRTRRDLEGRGGRDGRDLDARGNQRRTFVAEFLELVVALQVDGDVLRLLLLLLGHGGFVSDAHTKVARRRALEAGWMFRGRKSNDFETAGDRSDVSSVSDVTQGRPSKACHPRRSDHRTPRRGDLLRSATRARTEASSASARATGRSRG